MMGRVVAAGLCMLALTGCRAVFGMLDPEPAIAGDDQPSTDGRNDDTPVDVELDAPAICASWQAKHFQPCSIPSPGPETGLLAAASPYLFDTTGGTLVDKDNNSIAVTTSAFAQVGGPTVRVWSLDKLTVNMGATLRIVGDKPLLVASWSDIQIAGTVDAGSHRGERVGAGAGLDCVGVNGQIGGLGLSTGGSGGGGGGAFSGAGGNGGIADAPQNVPGGPGGAPVGVPAVIRAGCHGGDSGKAGPAAGLIPPATMDSQSLGGKGGGGVELAARLTLTISGRVLAGGAGGEGSVYGAACGGGGGGSGGFIGLDAAFVAVTASGILAANGGGAGGGAPYAQVGNPGSDGGATATAAPGGPVATGGCGPAGGNGSSRTVVAGTSPTSSDNCSNGGGGGGAGYILQTSGSLQIDSSAIITPPYRAAP